MAGLALTNPPQGTAKPCSQGAGTSGKAYLRKGRKIPQPNSFRERKRGPNKVKKQLHGQRERGWGGGSAEAGAGIHTAAMAGLWWSRVTVSSNKQQQQEPAVDKWCPSPLSFCHFCWEWRSLSSAGLRGRKAGKPMRFFHSISTHSPIEEGE